MRMFSVTKYRLPVNMVRKNFLRGNTSMQPWRAGSRVSVRQSRQQLLRSSFSQERVIFEKRLPRRSRTKVIVQQRSRSITTTSGRSLFILCPRLLLKDTKQTMHWQSFPLHQRKKRLYARGIKTY